LISKVENELFLKLFSEEERKDHILKFNINDLLRVDLKTKSEFYREMFNIGVYSINEIRNELDMEKIEN
jgi:hypothetical protein